MLCARKGLFGGGTLVDQLSVAYALFMEHCVTMHKTTAVKHWGHYRELGMSSLKAFPTSIAGKGYDTGLVASWLTELLHGQDGP